jgi:hypothetical protein
MVALAERTDTQPRVVEGKKATSVALGGETFSFTPEGKTMAMRGFEMVNPQDVSPVLREVAHTIMRDRGIAVESVASLPANDFSKLPIPEGLTTGLSFAHADSAVSQPVNAALPVSVESGRVV